MKGTHSHNTEPEQELYANLDARPISQPARCLIGDLRRRLDARGREDGGRINQRRGKMLARYESLLSAFVADLIRAAGDRRAAGWAYRSLRKETLSVAGISWRSLHAIVDGLADIGLIEKVQSPRKGGASPFGEPGERATFYVTEAKAARFRATPSLLGIAEDLGITPTSLWQHFASEAPDEVLTLRAKKGPEGEKRSNISFRTTPKYNHLIPQADKLEAEIGQLNAFLARHTVEGAECTGFRRVLNDGDTPGFRWNKGGRIYIVGNVQTMSERARLSIRIDGGSVSEIDVKGSQLLLMHGLLGEPYEPGVDPYAVEGLRPLMVGNTDMRRWAVKNYVVAGWGLGRPPRRWPQKVREEFAGKTSGLDIGSRFPPSLVRKALEAKFPAYRRWGEVTLTGADLVFVESCALLKTMIFLMSNHDVLSLPVHDSLIVKTEHVDITKEALRNSYVSLCGLLPTLVVNDG